jgi:hypothetical protein
VGKSLGKLPFSRLRRIWKENIKMDPGTFFLHKNTDNNRGGSGGGGGGGDDGGSRSSSVTMTYYQTQYLKSTIMVITTIKILCFKNVY